MLSWQSTNTLKNISELKVVVCHHLFSLLVDTEHTNTKRQILCLMWFSHIRKFKKPLNLKCIWNVVQQYFQKYNSYSSNSDICALYLSQSLLFQGSPLFCNYKISCLGIPLLTLTYNNDLALPSLKKQNVCVHICVCAQLHPELTVLFFPSIS